MAHIPQMCGNRMNIHIPSCGDEPSDDAVWVDVTGRAVDCHTVESVGYGVYDVVIHATASKLNAYFEQGRTVKVRDKLDRSAVPSYPSIEGNIVGRENSLIYHFPFHDGAEPWLVAENADSMPVGALYCLY